MAVPEAALGVTEHGLVPEGEGWFVLNACDARWERKGGRGVVCAFEGHPPFAQLGVNLRVLGPGEPMAMYHWEADQEDFLVLDGEALLVIEEQERPLRRWDLAHCPPGAGHVIVGAGERGCLVLAVGARAESLGEDWGGYPVSEAAARHGASVETETDEPREAYAHLPPTEPTAYREGWLPE